MTTLEGSCSCGAISVSVPNDRPVGTCHCTDCRKATGGTHGISVDVKQSDFKLTGTPKVYEVTGISGQKVRRYFCGTCGSPVYVQCDLDKAENEDESKVFVKIGLFAPRSTTKPTLHLFARDMEDWERPVEGARVEQTQ